jgi:hypothetical protein
LKNVAAAIVAVMIIFGAAGVSAAADSEQGVAPDAAPASAEEKPKAERIESGGVWGRVVDDGGKPIIGALVVVKGAGRSALTKSEGYYVITSVPAGTYEIQVYRVHYRDAGKADVRVTAGRDTNVNFVLGPRVNGEAAAEDEDGRDDWRTECELEHRVVKRNAFAIGGNMALLISPEEYFPVGFGADVSFILLGLFAVGATFDAKVCGFNVIESGPDIAGFGGVAARLYFSRYYRKSDLKTYVGGCYGRCRVPFQGELKKGYYYRGNLGIEGVDWPLGLYLTIGGQVEVAGENGLSEGHYVKNERIYLVAEIGCRFFI